MDPDMFIKFLHYRKHIIDYLYMSAAALLIYDYILTLHLEIKYIWFSRWSYTKVLSLLIRYMPFLDAFVIFYDCLSTNLSAEGCKVTYSVVGWLLLSKTVLAETVLCLRTWAIWNRNRISGIILVVLMLANLAVQCFLLTDCLRSFRFAPSPYPGYRGCLIVSASRVFWADFASLLVVEAIVFTLVIISAVRFYRLGFHNEIALVVHNDGILFYVYLLFLTGANIVVALVAPAAISGLLVPLEDVLYSVFTVRIILNIRGVASRQGMETELHTSYAETHTQATPLHFVPIEIFTYHGDDTFSV